MANTVQARKQKGRRLQQYVAKEILKLFPELTERDVRSTPMGVTGEDVQLSEKASALFPYSVECKNKESLSIWAELKQCEQDSRDLTPLLVFHRNNSKTYCSMEFEYFMKLLEEMEALKDYKYRYESCSK